MTNVAGTFGWNNYTYESFKQLPQRNTYCPLPNDILLICLRHDITSAWWRSFLIEFRQSAYFHILHCGPHVMNLLFLNFNKGLLQWWSAIISPDICWFFIMVLLICLLCYAGLTQSWGRVFWGLQDLACSSLYIVRRPG